MKQESDNEDKIIGNQIKYLTYQIPNTKYTTYKISKLVQFPMLSGTVPVKLLPLTSLKNQGKQKKKQSVTI